MPRPEIALRKSPGSRTTAVFHDFLRMRGKCTEMHSASSRVGKPSAFRGASAKPTENRDGMRMARALLRWSRKHERARTSMNDSTRPGLQRKALLRTHVRERARACARARDARAGARTLARAMRFRAVGILTALMLAFALVSRGFASPLDDAAERAVALVRALPGADGARIEVEALPFDARTNVAPCGGELASGLVGKKLTGARATVRVRCTDPANPWSVAVALRVALFRRVLVAKHALVRGDVVDADTTELAERDVLQLGYGHLDDPARYAGARVVRPIIEGAAIAPTAIAAPLLVERGATVTLLARGNAIDVRATGVAVEDGSAGMRVRVRNASSGRTVDGIVDGPGLVLVRP
jgi:flagella basal body P-ring formation protein FlgA